MQPISVIIPFYKDQKLLYTNLLYNKKFLSGCEIIVVNDSPEVSIVKELQKIDRSVIVVTNPKNLGFGPTINAGVKKSSRTFVFLLNMDVVLKDNSFLRALNHFKSNTHLFGVSFAQKEKNGAIVGANEGYFHNGMFHHRAKNSLVICPTLWPEGGSCLISRNLFLSLTGYDADYAPFYWEDVDLGYRAQKKGLVSLFDPTIVVEHHHETIIGSHFTNEQITTIATRNQFLFIWKNIRGARLVKHILLLPYLLVSQRQNRYFIKGFELALSKFLHVSHD